MTRAVQGGDGGLADRRVYTDRAKTVAWKLNGQTDVQPASALAPGEPTLRRGSTGKNVKRVQVLLTAAGFDPGFIDSKFGPGTENAVSAFQESRAIPVDGVVGPDTWAALEAKPV